MHSLGEYCWYVKMPRCGCVEHEFEYITFYFQEHITLLAACSGPLLVRDGSLGTPTFVKLTWWKRSSLVHSGNGLVTNIIQSNTFNRGDLVPWLIYARPCISVFNVGRALVNFYGPYTCNTFRLTLGKRYCSLFVTSDNCELVTRVFRMTWCMIYMVSWYLVNIVKLLPEPMLITHQWGLMAFIWRQYSVHLSSIWVWKLIT